ncbi:MAG TPA: hypothetical protein VJL58_01595 [Pyrinomonadaceae bacterium]|nr:hypothetical protein [Pyrinomonadaceae bacterium]
MNGYVLRLLKYAGIGIIAVPLTILTHELGHFAAYHLFGAANVRLHSASVSADKEMLSAGQTAAANILGPLISYLTIVLAYFLTKKRYVAFWIIVALAAPLGRIVNAVYIYFRALGYQPKPNFDEFNFAAGLGFDPLLIAVPTMVIVIGTFIYFGRKGWIEGGIRELASLLLGLVPGVAVWFAIGPYLLP